MCRSILDPSKVMYKFYNYVYVFFSYKNTLTYNIEGGSSNLFYLVNTFFLVFFFFRRGANLYMI